MKKFIMCCPLQPENELRKVKYNTVENKKLEYGKTRFPVITMINAYATEGETVQVIMICTEHENLELNRKYFLEELEELKNRKGINCDVKELFTPYDENIKTQIGLFVDLICMFSSNDELYACMTYGAKPTPMIEMMALSYAYRALDNVNIGCIVYGKFDHSTKESRIYDITSLLYLDEMVKNIAAMDLKNPSETIRLLMAG